MFLRYFLTFKSRKFSHTKKNDKKNPTEFYWGFFLALFPAAGGSVTSAPDAVMLKILPRRFSRTRRSGTPLNLGEFVSDQENDLHRVNLTPIFLGPTLKSLRLLGLEISDFIMSENVF